MTYMVGMFCFLMFAGSPGRLEVILALYCSAKISDTFSYKIAL